MDDKLNFINETEAIPLTDLSLPGRTGDDVLDGVRRTPDDEARRKLVDDVIQLLSPHLGPAPMDSRPSTSGTTAFQPGVSTTVIPRRTGALPVPPTVSNLAVPLRNGNKLDLTELRHILPKDVKIKFDATEHNVTMKNVMKDVAKYGDKYAGSTTATKGVLTFSILLQNLAQLKTVIKAGPDNVENFWILVILVPLSLVMQLIGAALIIYLANSKGDTNEDIRRLYGVTKWILYISSAASLLNTVIAAMYLSE